MNSKINWVGLTAAITTFILIIISIFVPWWKLIIGNNLLLINLSPIYTNFTLIENSFVIPLILALNITSIILLSAGGITLLIYSLKPREKYSKKLLQFGYKKPIYALIIFLIALLIVIVAAQSYIGINIPLVGSQIVTLPSELTQELTINLYLTANFQWPFILAIIVTILCILTKIFHKKYVALKNFDQTTTNT